MQDPDNAWLSPCALPYLVFAPAGVILIIVFGYLLGPLIERWRPSWTFPFITDQDEGLDVSDECQRDSVRRKQSIRWTLALLACSAIGSSAEVVNCFPPGIDLPSIVLAASWVSSHRLHAQDQLTQARPQQLRSLRPNGRDHVQFLCCSTSS